MSSARRCRVKHPITARLADIRRHRGISQVTLSAFLNISQPHVAKTEGKSDMLISTLARYVKGLGGELRLVAKFPLFETEVILKSDDE